MIAYVQGTLVEKEFTHAVVDVNGIGFSLLIPMSTYDQLPRAGEKVKVQTYLHVREDIMQLYGFATSEERALFLMLIEVVSGVGPKLALNVLSYMKVEQFCQAIAAKDLKALERINGIGKRSAERLVVELHGKIAEISPKASFTGMGAVQPELTAVAEDAVAGLVNLGFKGDAARKTVSRILEESPSSNSVEKLIRQALTQMNR